ncbi:MAG: hypothetical protein EA001_05780 [Oscillatoriales cyanobacterium]|nr:MAG: hypothetical protein EA001_05780 [Oscillatoriales cyanobacterium]
MGHASWDQSDRRLASPLIPPSHAIAPALSIALVRLQDLIRVLTVLITSKKMHHPWKRNKIVVKWVSIMINP